MSCLTRFSRSTYSSNLVRHWKPQTYQIAKMSDKSSFNQEHGSVSSAFKADGPLGDTAKQVGGPFDEKGVIGGTVQNAAETAQGDKPSAFDAQGMIGEKFTTKGAIGGTLEDKVGGPFSEQGAIGKSFTEKGAIGGTVQSILGDKK